MRAHDGDFMDDEHYHVVCMACHGPRERAEIRSGRLVRPDPYALEGAAQIVADRENAEPYMQGFGLHKHIVLPCHAPCVAR